jgi:uncharacterized membrane protein
LKLLGLGFPEGALDCTAHAVSGDGATVVGLCSIVGLGVGAVSKSVAVKWTLQGGVEPLPLPAGGSTAFDVNHDGSVIVGFDSTHGPFRLSPDGLEYLAESGAALSTSADGRVVVGAGDPGAFLWSVESGLRLLVASQANWVTDATAVSADGTTVVGREGDENGSTALTWSLDGEAHALATLSGATDLLPAAVSGDGRWIVGNAWVEGGTMAVRWSQHGIEVVGPLDSFATAMSRDGGLIFGSVATKPVVWEGAQPARQLDAILSEAGADITEWRLSVLDVSSDGKTVVGQAQYLGPLDGRLRAFIAWLP